MPQPAVPPHTHSHPPFLPQGSVAAIPTLIGKLSALTALSLAGAHVGGTIPSEVSKLTRLLSLDASNNALSGEIPVALWSLPFLRSLDLSGNAGLGGTIDTECKEIDSGSCRRGGRREGLIRA